MVKRTTGALVMCAVLVIIAAAPLVQSEDAVHTIVKGPKGPSESAVNWLYTPSEDGVWQGHIVNDGLRWLIIAVYDDTASAFEIERQMIRFAAYETNEVDTLTVDMKAGHQYSITATPNGVEGSSCTVEDVFTGSGGGTPPVAAMSVTTSYLTVVVDGSGSSDSDGSIVSYAWTFGDGGTASGQTATHTYAADGTYTIVLTVTDDDGLTGTTSQPVTVAHEPVPPVASFTVTADGLTVSVDASASSASYGAIESYSWDWGDGSEDGTGVTASHTYVAPVTLIPAPEATLSQGGETRAPAPPINVMGYTKDAGGAALPGCAVTITNLRTAESAVTSSDSAGYYLYDLNTLTLGWLGGDVIQVEAVKDSLSGVNTGTCSAGMPFLFVDVTLTGEAPEPFYVTITLTVTDEDGLIATLSKMVELYP